MSSGQAINVANWLNMLFGYVRAQFNGGAQLPQENVINFLSPLTAVDNPGNGSTDISISGSVVLAAPVMISAGVVPTPGGGLGIVSQPYNTANGVYAISMPTTAQRGCRCTLTHTGGPLAEDAPCPLSDANGYLLQDPQNPKNAPIPTLNLSEAGNSETFELVTGDPTYGTFWMAV